MKRIITGRRENGQSVVWVDGLNGPLVSEGWSTARTFECEKGASIGLRTAQKLFKGVTWKIELISDSLL